MDWTWVGPGVIALGGIAAIAVYRKKIDDHHKVLYGAQTGEVAVVTKLDCDASQEEYQKHVCKKIDVVNDKVDGVKDSVDKMNEKWEKMSEFVGRVDRVVEEWDLERSRNH